MSILCMNNTTVTSGSLGHNYIGLLSLQQKAEMVNGAHLPYIKALNDFIIPVSRIELAEILGKGKQFVTCALT